MKAGQETKMLRGAIWACVIPVGLGLILLIALVVSLRTVSRGSNLLDDVVLIAPLIICFIFGTPIAAWLACRSLRKINDLKKLTRWRSSAGRALVSATLFQTTFASIHIILVSIHFSQGVSWSNFNSAAGFGEIVGISIAGAMINFVLWLIITLPLSLLCATIFWKVTKFPKDTSVF